MALDSTIVPDIRRRAGCIRRCRWKRHWIGALILSNQRTSGQEIPELQTPRLSIHEPVMTEEQ